jgi:hypothetical protein
MMKEETEPFLKIAQPFKACHYPHLFDVVLVLLISNLLGAWALLWHAESVPHRSVYEHHPVAAHSMGAE